ncbi:MAG: FlgD immunoglobulin-like domain containing protein [candidate division KSB1 bacterium]|nr:FlgD immunoglobulin-like domain containing protein [candidate division KSB1 bacterium]
MRYKLHLIVILLIGFGAMGLFMPENALADENTTNREERWDRYLNNKALGGPEALDEMSSEFNAPLVNGGVINVNLVYYPQTFLIFWGPLQVGEKSTKTFNFINASQDTFLMAGCLLASDDGVFPKNGFNITSGYFDNVKTGAEFDTLFPGESHTATVVFSPKSVGMKYDILGCFSHLHDNELEYRGGMVQFIGAAVDVDFSATPTSGYPRLGVQFTNETRLPDGGPPPIILGSANNNQNNVPNQQTPFTFLWEFSDGRTSTAPNPTMVFTEPGYYSASLTMFVPDYNYIPPIGPLNNSNTTNATNDVGVIPLTTHKKDLIHVLGDEPMACYPLSLIDNSSAFVKQGWENAIDNDVSGWDGTVTTKADPPYAVFEFFDGSIQTITHFKFMTDTDVGYNNRWVHDFRVLVSTTGLSDTDFSEVLDAHQKGGDWQRYPVAPVEARYVKLVLDTPTAGWRQVGEFQVCVDGPVVNAGNSSLTATSPHVGNGVDQSIMTATVNDSDGNPITGISPDEFHRFYWNNWGHIVDTAFEETDTPGVYESKIACMIESAPTAVVFVRGLKLGQAKIEFKSTGYQPLDLSVVEGSETFQDQTWDKSIDGDTEGWDGVTTTRGQTVYAVYEFTDGLVHPVQGLRLLSDANTPKRYPNRFVKRFQVQVSTSGLSESDFTTVYTGTQDTWDWKTHLFSVVNAKYVRLVVDYPDHGWVQIAELEVLGMDAVGSARLTDVEERAGVPTAFKVYDNAPNPFNPSTQIRYDLPNAMAVTVEVYNAVGQQVRTLYDGMASAGRHQLTWNGRDDAGRSVSSGVFLLRVRAGSEQTVKRMLLIK